MGFGIPLKAFFSDARFHEYLHEKVLPGIRERELFDHKIVSDWIHNIRSLLYYELEALWVIISFEVWASIYLNNYENRNT
jgi:asparagine synthase (glutamine-hydrolysing)